MRTRVIVIGVMAAAVVAVGVVVLTGGGAEKKSTERKIADPLAEALAYATPDAPVVAVVETDPEQGQGRAVGDLMGRFAGVDIGLGLALDRIGAGSLTLEGDLLPQLGNPAAITVDPATRAFTAALVVRDADAMRQTIENLVSQGDAQPGAVAGDASIYTLARFAVALAGPVVVIAGDEAGLRAALDIRRARRGLTRSAFDRRTRGLPRDVLARAAVDAKELLPGLLGGAAGRDPFVRALGFVGVGLRAEADGVRVLLRGRADPDRLVSSDVPLAPGPQSPSPAGGDEGIVIGVRDLSHTLDIVERALEQSGDERYKDFDKVRDALRRFGRIDVDGLLLDQLRGTTTITGDGTEFVFRGELRDGQDLRNALSRVAAVSGLAFDAAGIGEYELEPESGEKFVLSRDGEPLVAFGVVDDVVVVATDPAVDIEDVAAREPGRAPARPGAVAGRIDGEILRNAIVDRLALPSAAAIVLGPLEGLTFRLQADVDGIEGEAFLRVGE